MRIAYRIEMNPEVMLGKPVIRGTRIPVELILRRISEGATEGDLLVSYPHLKREDVRAATASLSMGIRQIVAELGLAETVRVD